MNDALRVLLLPGWLDSGPTHWQTRWQALHGFDRVQQADWQWPRRGDWMARLDEVLLADDRPAVLAAHSLGCLLVAAWAAHSQHTARVTGALLVAPPDVERDDLAPQLWPWRPIARRPLGRPSLALMARKAAASRAKAGANRVACRSSAASWVALGKTSFDDWQRLT